MCDTVHIRRCNVEKFKVAIFTWIGIGITDLPLATLDLLRDIIALETPSLIMLTKLLLLDDVIWPSWNSLIQFIFHLEHLPAWPKIRKCTFCIQALRYLNGDSVSRRGALLVETLSDFLRLKGITQTCSTASWAQFWERMHIKVTQNVAIQIP